MQKILKLIKQAETEVVSAKTLQLLDLIRIKYLGKKGIYTASMKQISKLKKNEIPVIGREINDAKKILLNQISFRRTELELDLLSEELNKDAIDITLQGRLQKKGGRHPVSSTKNRIERIFRDSGFGIRSGPEIEDEYHNFTALNIPNNHPARAMHDTFYFSENKLLRTHTSPVQIRSMVTDGAPIRIIVPGKVYRCDSDQTHTPMFHQIEGLVVDVNISFANLKAILHQFVEKFFEREAEIRFRPSYFPFTEPSAEVDILWNEGKWLEILGCGMVHPNVLENVGINSSKYTGYAFGMGIERLAMLRYGVTDLRNFFENDLRFLQQFN
jgi:phenylalanyl-tRNA synthetase alpha chain